MASKEAIRAGREICKLHFQHNYAFLPDKYKRERIKAYAAIIDEKYAELREEIENLKRFIQETNLDRKWGEFYKKEGEQDGIRN